MDQLKRLAAYYRDVLLLLSENSARALRNLRIGRAYGLVADLSAFSSTLGHLLQPSVAFERIAPELETKDFFPAEPEPALGETEPAPREPPHDPRIDEADALRRIWRKQTQDPYNRETLLGVGLLHTRRGTATLLGPLVCYRVRPQYFPDTRRFTIERITEVPFPNLTLIGQILTQEELVEIRPKLHQVLNEEEFSERTLEQLARILTGTAQSLSRMVYWSKGLRALKELTSPEASSPALAAGAVLVNLPRGNAYLLDDLEALLEHGDDNLLGQTAVGPILETPTDDEGAPREHPNSDLSSLLFPLLSNKAQRDVAGWAESARVLVVHGPPGTGKSQTICNLICHLVGCGKTVLVTSEKNKALEVVRDKLPQVPYLAMSLLRSDRESQNALLRALEHYHDAIGQSGRLELERTRSRLMAAIHQNRETQSALVARFSELRRIEHEHFPTFKRMADLRDVNVLDPQDLPSSEDPRRAGAALQEYADVCREVARRKTDTERYLLGERSLLSAETINAALAAARQIEAPLSRAVDLMKTDGVTELGQELETVGCRTETVVSALQHRVSWLEQQGLKWLQARARAHERKAPGCDLASLRALFDKIGREQLRSCRDQAGRLLEAVQELQQTSLPKRYAKRVVHDWQISILGEVVDALKRSENSLLRWFLWPDARGARRWVEANRFPRIPWFSRRSFISELEALHRHWQLRWRIQSGMELLTKWGILSESLAVDAPVPRLQEQIDLAYLRIELMSLLPVPTAPGSEPVEWVLDERLDLLRRPSELDAEIAQLRACAQLLDARNEIHRARPNLPEEVFGRSLQTIYSGSVTLDPACAESILKDLRGYISTMQGAAELTRLEDDLLRNYAGSLATLRANIEAGTVPSWVSRASDAVEAHRLFALARRVNEEVLDDTNVVTDKLRQLKDRERELVVQLLTVQQRFQLVDARDSKASAFAIEKLKKLLKRKKKTATFESLKKEIPFSHLLRVFPCWLLSIDDVARVFPLEAGLFDYLIVDESSQCNQAAALHLAYRAKRMIVVGDEKQLPNAQVQWLKTEIIEQLLARHGLGSHPKRDFLNAKESLLGLALSSRDREVHLNEHFRCEPEIISWSNRMFYNESLKVLTPRRRNRFSPPVEVRFVPGAAEDRDRQINEKEAQVVVDALEQLIRDPRCEDLSVGVISPFRQQADYINDLIGKRFHNQWGECERRGVIANTADGFQGDERDIILYSLRHGPNSTPGSITAIEANQGERRLNVAFTRARRRAILFCSLPPEKFPGTFIRSFLSHALDIEKTQRTPPPPDDRFESEFEREVCGLLRGRGFSVVSQFEFARYRIDLVVRDAEGRRLGVECDGPFHYDEWGDLQEEDYERQEILERAGWTIYRIPARRFYLNPQREIDQLVEALRRQPTDAEIRAVEYEDLSFKGPSLEVEELELVAKTPEKETVVQPAHELPEAPPFSESGLWLALARWGVRTGRIQLSHREFLWRVGDRIRKGEALEPPDKERATHLWSLYLKQGFTPLHTEAEP